MQSRTALLKKQAFRTQFAYLSDVEKVTAVNEGKCICSSSAAFLQKQLTARTAGLGHMTTENIKLRERVTFLEKIVTAAAGEAGVDMFMMGLQLGDVNSLQCKVCDGLKARLEEAETKFAAAEKMRVATESRCKDLEQRWKDIAYENAGLKKLDG